MYMAENFLKAERNDNTYLQFQPSIAKVISKMILYIYTPFSEGFSCVWLFATPWTIARHAPLSMEFSRQEYWSEQPFHSPGDLPNPETEPSSHELQADSVPSEP